VYEVIRFRCECGRQLQAELARIGLTAQCPACQRTMTVPLTDEPLSDSPGAARGGGIALPGGVAQRPAPTRRTEEDEDAPARRPAFNPFARRSSSPSGRLAEWGLFLAVVGLVGVLMAVGVLVNPGGEAGIIAVVLLVGTFFSGFAAITCGVWSLRPRAEQYGGSSGRGEALVAVWLGLVESILAVVLFGLAFVLR
jgi:hypothetical protein